jgi:hypothetical protein
MRRLAPGCAGKPDEVLILFHLSAVLDLQY